MIYVITNVAVVFSLLPLPPHCYMSIASYHYRCYSSLCYHRRNTAIGILIVIAIAAVVITAVIRVIALHLADVEIERVEAIRAALRRADAESACVIVIVVGFERMGVLWVEVLVI
jgi:hypothetical protein